MCWMFCFVWKHTWNILPNTPNAIGQLQPAVRVCRWDSAKASFGKCRLEQDVPRKEEYQPLSHQNHSLRYRVPASIFGILKCHFRLSAHTHTQLVAGWAEEHHPFYPGKQSSYGKMTFTVLLLSRRAQNTHITPQLKTLSLLLCNCCGFFSPIWKLIRMTTGLATADLLNRTLATSRWVTAGLLLGRIPLLTSHTWYRRMLFWLPLCFNCILW